MLSDIAILAVESIRTKMYLYQLARYDLLPAQCLFLSSTPKSGLTNREVYGTLPAFIEPEIDLSISVVQLLERLHVPYVAIPNADPNSPECISAVRKCPQRILIFSGSGGAILRNDILETGKQFLHVHPGHLPEYRGSTTIYYSLLKEGTCAASALLLESGIDTGPVIYQKSYVVPSDRTTIDFLFDPWIRANLLSEVLLGYSKTGDLSGKHQDPSAGETYYIIHPTLKHIAILGNRSKV